MSSTWSDLVQHCQPVSNVSLVCRDGVVYTHKIVLASVSGFVKTLLSDIPVGDHVSVFLPDFCADDVTQFLENILLSRKNSNFDLCYIFQSPDTIEDCITPSSSQGKEVFVKKEVDDVMEEDGNSAGEGFFGVLDNDNIVNHLETEDLTTSNIEVKFDSSEYVLAKHQPDEALSPDPNTESVTINIKRKRSGGRPRLYPGESVQERNRARYKAWHALQREKFPEKVKLHS